METTVIDVAKDVISHGGSESLIILMTLLIGTFMLMRSVIPKISEITESFKKLAESIGESKNSVDKHIFLVQNLIDAIKDERRENRDMLREIRKRQSDFSNQAEHKERGGYGYRDNS